MFWYEEDIQPAVDAAAKLLGITGNMTSGPNTLYNVSVYTDPFGKIWYGDYSGTIDELIAAMGQLSAEIGQNCKFVIND